LNQKNNSCIQQSTYDHLKKHIEVLNVDVVSGLVGGGKIYEDNSGYLLVNFKNRSVRYHHVIGFYIFGERMVGKQINHINGNKKDNRAVNLEIMTPSENVRHSYETGLKKILRGEQVSAAKLTETDVVNIRRLRKEGLTLNQIAEKYNIQFQTVSKIVNRKAWAHVPDNFDEELADMNFDKYQELASRTANSDLTEFLEVSNYALGLVSEAAEVTDQIKKELFHGHIPDREKVKDELSDVMWYMSNLSNKYGLTLKEIAVHNIDKLKRRYPEGFSTERSVNRVD
jgi:NTP pyrophosphatase (non-canonical NTP hydrolase)